MRTRGPALGIVLLAAGTVWNAGNVGPIVSSLRDEFSASLAEVGMISGGVFFAAVLAAKLSGPALGGRIGAANGARLACLCCGAGNLVCAVAPSIGVLFAGRVVAGYGMGLAVLIGPAIARALGGVRMVGVFGAGVMAGIALALGLGGLLEDAGVDWRVTFGVSILTALAALPFLPRRVEVARPGPPRHGIVGRMIHSGGLWRLALLYVAAVGVPVTLSAWLVHYLTEGDGMRTALAGLLALLLFAAAGTARLIGGRLEYRGVPEILLTGVAPLVAALGVTAIALDRGPAVVLPAVVLMGLGFSLPYVAMVDETERLFPASPLAALSFVTAGGNWFPMAAIPLVGVALDAGNGEEALLLIAALVAFAGVVNLWPAAPK
jgi:predicted MFS family arabinose efflux permease